MLVIAGVKTKGLTLLGISRQVWFLQQMPDSTLPMRIEPMSLYLSITGMRNGLSSARAIGGKLSRYSINDGPL